MAVILVMSEYITLKSGKDIRLNEVKFNSQTLFLQLMQKLVFNDNDNGNEIFIVKITQTEASIIQDHDVS